MKRDRVIARLLNSIEPQPNGCWLWKGYTDDKGYGWTSARPEYLYVGVHRLAYELLVGPIPDGLTIDHTCHNADVGCRAGNSCLHRRCVNPDHLEPVTLTENILRSLDTIGGRNAAKTHCDNGHAFTEANTFTYRHRRSLCRGCRICRAAVDARRRARKRETAA